MSAATTYEVLIQEARKLGANHGRSAASWYFDGDESIETYAAVLRGISDGDPEVLDTFPSSPLSGEWVDDPTPASVLADLGTDESDDAATDYLDAYEDCFYIASMQEIERVAQFQVSA